MKQYTIKRKVPKKDTIEELDAISHHSVYCDICNPLLTYATIHYRRSICKHPKHQIKKFKNGGTGCERCLATWNREGKRTDEKWLDLTTRALQR